MGTKLRVAAGLWLALGAQLPLVAAPMLPGGEIDRRGLPPSTPQAARTGLAQATAAMMRGDVAGADRALATAISGCVGRGQAVHRVGLVMMRAQFLLAQDKPEEATEVLKLGYQIASHDMEKGNPSVGQILTMVAVTAELRGAFENAEILYTRAAEVVLAARDKDPVAVAIFLVAQANNLETLGKDSAALALIEKSLALLARGKTLEERFEETERVEAGGGVSVERCKLAAAAALGLALKAVLLGRSGRLDEARRVAEEAHDFGDRSEARLGSMTIPTRLARATAAEVVGDLAQAESLWKRIVATMEGVPLISPQQLASAEARLCDLYAARGRFDRVERQAPGVIAVLEARGRSRDLSLAQVRLALAQARAAGGQTEAAKSLAVAALAGFEAAFPPASKELARYRALAVRLGARP